MALLLEWFEFDFCELLEAGTQRREPHVTFGFERYKLLEGRLENLDCSSVEK